MTKQTDIAALDRLIEWPAAPDSVEWQTRQVGEGTDWELIAVLTYSPTTFETAMKAAPEKPGLDDAVGFKPFDWTEGAEGLEPSDGGMMVVKTGARSAEAFVSSPLTDGFAVAVPQKHQILVYLHTS